MSPVVHYATCGHQQQMRKGFGRDLARTNYDGSKRRIRCRPKFRVSRAPCWPLLAPVGTSSRDGAPKEEISKPQVVPGSASGRLSTFDLPMAIFTSGASTDEDSFARQILVVGETKLLAKATTPSSSTTSPTSHSMISFGSRQQSLLL